MRSRNGISPDCRLSGPFTRGRSLHRVPPFLKPLLLRVPRPLEKQTSHFERYFGSRRRYIVQSPMAFGSTTRSGTRSHSSSPSSSTAVGIGPLFQDLPDWAFAIDNIQRSSTT